MISFTSDTDWAPEAVIADTIQLFEQYGAKCTFFSTHHSEELARCNKKLFEIAIHPDFEPLLTGESDESAEDVIDKLLDLHPEARGVRSHAMLASAFLLQKFADKKLVYDSNLFLPYQKGLKPFRLWNGLVRIPYNWEDGVHWAYGYNFESCGMNLKEEVMNIFSFTPVNVFLNVENKFRYNAAKKYVQNPKKLLEYRNTELKGSRDLLISLLDFCKTNKTRTKTQIEIAEEFLYENTLP